MKQLIFTSVFCLTSLLSFSQKNSDITGHLKNIEDEALVSGSAILYFAKDSVLTAFSLTDDDGLFKIPKVAPNDYYIQFDYVGYNTMYKTIDKDDFDGEIDFGDLVLEANTDLEAVVVNNAPLEIRKDTITYDADAFQTEQNAMVEDLLKKLPGIEVDQEGNIKAQGEDVQNVLVDGKKFFGGDPKTVTKNIPADAVDKVSVYDKKSEKAEFTGIEDGEEEKTIDIELKEDRKKGYFGNVSAGGGSEETYKGKALISRFSPSTQLAFLGSTNNVNEEPFTWRDYNSLERSSMSGGMMQVQGGNLPRYWDNSSGIKRATAAGTNLNKQLGEKSELYLYYFYNQSTNDYSRALEREYFQNEGNLFYDELSNGENFKSGHRGALDYTFKPNKRNEIKLENSFNFYNDENEYLSITESLNGNNNLVNDNDTDSDSDNNSYNISSNLYYKHRFKKEGRSLFSEFRMNLGDLIADNRTISESNFYIEDRTDLLNQLIDTDNNSLDLSGQVSFTEPVAEQQYLEVNYRINTQDEENDQYFYDMVGSTRRLNEQLTNLFSRDYLNQNIGSTYRIIKDRHNLNFGLSYETAKLNGNTSLAAEEIDKTFNTLKPTANWRYEIKDGSRLYAIYSLNQRLPSVRELQPAIDNRNPLNIYQGNPDLEASINHRLYFGYYSFDQFTFNYYHLRGSLNLTSNPISRAQSFDENLIQTTTPVNTDNLVDGSLYGGFSTPIRALRTDFGLYGNWNLQDGQVFINGLQNDYSSFRQNYNLFLSNTNDEKISVYIDSNVDFSTAKYSENNERNQNFMNYGFGSGAYYRALENWEFGTNFTYTVYSQEAFAQDNKVSLLSGYISRSFAEKLGEIRLELNDLLNQNTGIRRSQNFNYSQEEISNVLGRYGILSVSWQIK